MTRNEFKALPKTQQILIRASSDIGYPEPSTNDDRKAHGELMAAGLIKSAGRPQNSTTNRYKITQAGQDFLTS